MARKLLTDEPWPAYCHDMAGTPAEYLVLVNLDPQTKNSGFALELAYIDV